MLKNIVFKIKYIFIPCAENKYCPIFLDSNFLFYYLVFLLILKIITVPFFLYLPQTSFFASLTKDALIELTNEERQSLGLNELQEDPLLSEAALEKAQNMLDLDYFSHESPKGIKPWYWIKKAGYSYNEAGENLAIGFLDAEEVFNAWETSPLHRDNIINPQYKDIGMAVLRGDFQGQPVTIVVQLFGVKASSFSLVKDAQAQETQVQGIKDYSVVEQKTDTEVLSGGIQDNIQEDHKEKIKDATEKTETNKDQKIVQEEKSIKEEYASYEGTAATGEHYAIGFFKSVFANYYDLVKRLISYSLVLVVVALFLAIFIKINIQSKTLLAKSAFFIIIFILFILIDKEILINLISRRLIIG